MGSRSYVRMFVSQAFTSLGLPVLCSCIIYFMRDSSSKLVEYFQGNNHVNLYFHHLRLSLSTLPHESLKPPSCNFNNKPLSPNSLNFTRKHLVHWCSFNHALVICCVFAKDQQLCPLVFVCGVKLSFLEFFLTIVNPRKKKRKKYPHSPLSFQVVMAQQGY